MAEHHWRLTITRGALLGLVVAYLLLIAALGYTVKLQADIDHERDTRTQEVNAALTLNCEQREAEFAALFRLLDRRNPAPYDCRKLPVFVK